MDFCIRIYPLANMLAVAFCIVCIGIVTKRSLFVYWEDNDMIRKWKLVFCCLNTIHITEETSW